MTQKKQIEEASKKLIEEIEREEREQEIKSLGNVRDLDEVKLGIEETGNDISQGNKLGYVEIDLKKLPSQGYFYPIGTKIFIKPALGAEIKHWSTIDETDPYSIDERLNFIIERCVKITAPDKRMHIKDILDIDRFSLILMIHERTFVNGENKLWAEVSNSSKSETVKVQVTHHIINYYKPDERLMRLYDDEKRCFVKELPDGEVVHLYLPSIGVSSFLRDYKLAKEQRRESIDEDFAQYSLFIFGDWRGLTNKVYENTEAESNMNWSIYKTSLLSQFTQLIKESINPTMTVVVGGEEVTVPLNFQGGLKAIFVIPDILG